MGNVFAKQRRDGTNVKSWLRLRQVFDRDGEIVFKVYYRRHDRHIIFKLEIVIPRPFVVPKIIPRGPGLWDFFHADAELAEMFSLVDVLDIIEGRHKYRD